MPKPISTTARQLAAIDAALADLQGRAATTAKAARRKPGKPVTIGHEAAGYALVIERFAAGLVEVVSVMRHLGLDEAQELLGARLPGEIGRVQRERDGLTLPGVGSARPVEDAPRDFRRRGTSLADRRANRLADMARAVARQPASGAA